MAKRAGAAKARVHRAPSDSTTASVSTFPSRPPPSADSNAPSAPSPSARSRTEPAEHRRANPLPQNKLPTDLAAYDEEDKLVCGGIGDIRRAFNPFDPMHCE